MSGGGSVGRMMKVCVLDRAGVNKRIDSSWRTKFITDVGEAIDGVVSKLDKKQLKDVAWMKFRYESMSGNSFTIRLWVPNAVKDKHT